MIGVIRKLRIAVILTSGLLNACSGGSEGTGLNTETVPITGTVSAPGGAIAFNRPGLVQRMFAAIWGTNAYAAIEGVANVGPGVTVNLIEVDADGIQVGNVIASTTTNTGGNFTLQAPEGFLAGSQYVIRAVGSSENIDARVAATALAVNPITDAASDLLTETTNNLGLINTTELEELVTTIDDLSKDIDPSGLSAQALSEALQQEAINDEDSNNIFTSSASSGQICGTVTDSDGIPLGDVRIIVRDFNNWVTRAKTRTASDGSYCLNVPKTGDPNPDTGGTFNGEYILGAINRTAVNSASEWWSASGTTYSQHDSGKITVADSVTVVRNFQLEDGGTINGVVTAGGTTPLEGIQIIIRNFDTRTPVASARSGSDGSFRVNLIAGTYFVETRNMTAQAYASEVYTDAGGSNSANDGKPVSVITSNITTLNFALGLGNRLDGVITDGVDGEAVAGRRVMVNLNTGGPSVRIRTNRLGQYRIWLKPDVYYLYAYGQKASGVNLTFANQTVNFESPDVSSLTATVLHNGNPVSQAKVRIHSSAGQYIGQELSNSDGTVTAYSENTGNVYVEVRIDAPSEYGTIIYDNDTKLLAGQAINIPSASSTVPIGDINLPNAGLLTGIVSSNGTPLPNFRVQVQDDNDLTGVNLANSGEFTRFRTRGDGSYLVSLPPGVYDLLIMQDATLSGNCGSITIVEGETTVVNYDNATDTCS